MVKWRNLCSNWQIVVVVYPGAGGREKKKKEKKKREKKSKKRSKGSPLCSALPAKKKRKTRERKFGGTNQISFFREIFLSQGERERERERGRDPSISNTTFINTLVTEEIYKARTKCNRSPHPTPFLRRARSAPSDLRTL